MATRSSGGVSPVIELPPARRMIACLLLGLMQRTYQRMVAPPAPHPIDVVMTRDLRAQLEQVPSPPGGQIPRDDGSLDWVIQRKLIHIPRHRTGWNVWKAIAGMDGSILAKESDGLGENEDSFVIPQPPNKQLVASQHRPEDLYLDVLHRAYAANAEAQSSMSQTGPPLLHVVSGKADREYGVGDPILFWSPDEILTKTWVDSRCVPSSFEFYEDDFLRLYDHRKPVEIGLFDLVGWLPDHTYVLERLASGKTMKGWRYVFFSQHIDLYFWRSGRFLHAWRLPTGWEPVMCNGSGDVLVRLVEDNDPEASWTIGIVHDGKLSRITFKRPPGTEKLLWRETQSFSDEGVVQFEAFWGNDERHFKLTPYRT